MIQLRSLQASDTLFEQLCPKRNIKFDVERLLQASSLRRMLLQDSESLGYISHTWRWLLPNHTIFEQISTSAISY
jgi:hypothetical protein